jgi:hypothetical protein
MLHKQAALGFHIRGRGLVSPSGEEGGGKKEGDPVIRPYNRVGGGLSRGGDFTRCWQGAKQRGRSASLIAPKATGLTQHEAYSMTGARDVCESPENRLILFSHGGWRSSTSQISPWRGKGIIQSVGGDTKSRGSQGKHPTCWSATTSGRISQFKKQPF